MEPKPPRPTGVTLLAVLEILCGLTGVGLGVLLSIVNPFGFPLVYLGILDLAVGIGFLRGKGWTRKLGMVVAPFAMIQVAFLSILLDIGRPVFNLPGAVISLVFWIVVIWIMILYYLTRPPVKAFFAKERRW